MHELEEKRFGIYFCLGFLHELDFGIILEGFYDRRLLKS